MAKPGGDRKIQGQGINILNPNGGPAISVPYQSGGKNAPDIETLKKNLEKGRKMSESRISTTVNMGKSTVYKPMGAKFMPPVNTGRA